MSSFICTVCTLDYMSWLAQLVQLVIHIATVTATMCSVSMYTVRPRLSEADRWSGKGRPLRLGMKVVPHCATCESIATLLMLVHTCQLSHNVRDFELFRTEEAIRQDCPGFCALLHS